MTGVHKKTGYRFDIFSTGVQPNGQMNLTCTVSALTSPLRVILISVTSMIFLLTEVYRVFSVPKCLFAPTVASVTVESIYLYASCKSFRTAYIPTS